MAVSPQKIIKEKGFWDGGSSGHRSNKESGGRPNGYPGRRAPSRTGVRTDIEGLTPQEHQDKD
jgi:hypothetical protein